MWAFLIALPALSRCVTPLGSYMHHMTLPTMLLQLACVLLLGIMVYLVAKTALELAEQIASFPQLCLRHDRQSVLEQWSLNEAGALLNETRLGLQTLASGETVEGATRFAQGQGRHGQF